jgi:hypothetical protein
VHRAYRITALLVLATASAAAEPPQVGVLAGMGARDSWGPGRYLIPYHPVDPAPHAAVIVTIAAPISPHLALGAHTGASKEVYADGVHDCYDLISIDLAIALQYMGPHFTVTSWLGQHISRFNSIGAHDCVDGGTYTARWTDDFTSYGVTGTVDLLTRGSHHLAVFADAQTGTGSGHIKSTSFSSDGFNYSAVSVGLAYRR